MVNDIRALRAQISAMNRANKDKDYRKRHPDKRSRSIEWPFIGCDGEGGDLNGRHHYLMLRMGDNTLMHKDRSLLTTLECLDFICEQPKENRINVGYFFDYDVTHILRDLADTDHGRYKLERLLDRNSRRRIFNNRTDYFPVDYAGYEFDYLPRKEFKVRRKGEKRYAVINDVGPFFQCAFLTALKDWKIGTPEEWAHIAEGKSGRVNFAELTDETIAYNGREIALLEQLMTEFRKATIAAEMLPAKWQGPGQIATSIFKQTGMIKGDQLRESLPADLLTAANASYFGGRFEITGIGQIPGPVFQHDINSAYPFSETLLPCLEHGQWTHTLGTQLPNSGLFLAYGSFTARKQVNLYGLPHRSKKGNICWPGSAGKGWYWSHEISAAIYQRFDVSEVWIYRQNCTCAPFAWVPAKYEERAKLGKEAKGIAIKLGLNSTYGKTCQSVGEPQYANPIYASLITSLTRAQLYRKCVRLGVDKVVMLATDGIFTTSEIDKDHSPKIEKDGYTLKPLGDWEVKTYPEGIFIVQPGLYLLPGEAKPKTRGVPMNLVQSNVWRFREVFDKLYLEFMDNPFKVPWMIKTFTVDIEMRSLINLRLGVHTKHWGDIGQWIPVVKKISYDWRTKRSFPEFHDGWISVYPHWKVDNDNTPYSKDIGAMMEQRMLNTGIMTDPDSPEYFGAWEE